MRDIKMKIMDFTIMQSVNLNTGEVTHYVYGSGIKEEKIDRGDYITLDSGNPYNWYLVEYVGDGMVGITQCGEVKEYGIDKIGGHRYIGEKFKKEEKVEGRKRRGFEFL
jgi:hypothetical protein